jgi:tetratricopeptide (TPR) repeat protein
LEAFMVRRLVVSGTLVVIALAGTAGAFLLRSRREVTTSSAEAYRYYLAGRENDQKMYEQEAITAYAEALKFDPHFHSAAIRLELLQHRADTDNERIKSLVASARRDADSLTPRERLLIDILSAALDNDDAAREKYGKEYIRRFPRDPEGYKERAQFLMKNDKLDEAIAVYQQLLSVDPNYAIAYNSLGYYSMGKSEFGKAEDYLKRYQYLAPDQANPYDSLGELYANLGRYDDAESSLKKALEIKPDFAPAWAHLGTVQVGRGNLLAAAEDFRRAAEMTESVPFKFSWSFARASALLAAGKPDEAWALSEKIDASFRSRPEGQARSWQSWLAFRRTILATLTNHLDAARESLRALDESVAKMKPYEQKDWTKNVEIVRALLARAEGRHEEAVAGFRNFVSEKKASMSGFDYFPDREYVRMAYAESLVALGRKSEAEDALRPILVRNPKFEPALQLVSRLGLSAPDASKAIAHANPAPPAPASSASVPSGSRPGASAR